MHVGSTDQFGKVCVMGSIIICVARANTYNVAHDRVDPIVLRAVRATNYVECVLVGAV